MPKNLLSHLQRFLLLGVFTLAACGQKGPLYLPEKDAQITPTQSTNESTKKIAQ